MGLFDEIVSMVGSRLSNSEQHNDLMHSVFGLLNDPRHGGVAGLVRAFHDNGLGGVVSSWIGTGQNQPISAEQIQQVLGNEQIQQIAQRIGIPPQEASSALAALLPQVIDKLSPNGTLPEGALLEQGLGFLRNQLLRK